MSSFPTSCIPGWPFWTGMTLTMPPRNHGVHGDGRPHTCRGGLSLRPEEPSFRRFALLAVDRSGSSWTGPPRTAGTGRAASAWPTPPCSGGIAFSIPWWGGPRPPPTPPGRRHVPTERHYALLLPWGMEYKSRLLRQSHGGAVLFPRGGFGFLDPREQAEQPFLVRNLLRKL
jgi:hypothetical protein